MKENKKETNTGSHSIANSLLQNKQNGKSLPAASTAQLKEISVVQKVEEKEPLQGKFATLQKQENKVENKTGLPDNLKSGIENLSGVDISDVNVHYNSDKPAQLNAHAFAQGTEIHVAAGQEKHLPHEAWHTVQQKQGRVTPTFKMKKDVAVNDDSHLEKEADQMGDKANSIKNKSDVKPLFNNFNASISTATNFSAPVVQRVVGEDGNDWDKIQTRERSNAITDTPEEVLKLRKKAAFKARLEGNLANKAEVANVKEPSKRTQIGRKLGLVEGPTAKEMASASYKKDVDKRATANQVGLLGITAAKIAGKVGYVDSEQASAAAAGQTEIGQQNSNAQKQINQSLALKGGAMALNAGAAATSLIPDPLTGSLVKAVVKGAGAGVNYAGAHMEAQSGAMLSKDAEKMGDGGILAMNLAAEGEARTENAKLGKKDAKNAGMKAALGPVTGMLGEFGVGDKAADGLSKYVGKAAKAGVSYAGGKAVDKFMPPSTEEQQFAVKEKQANAQVSKERLNNQSIKPEHNEQQDDILKALKKNKGFQDRQDEEHGHEPKPWWKPW